jgi:hypothetical protein
MSTALSQLDEVDGYVTVPRAAAMLGVKPTRMHELLDGGAIPYVVPAKQRRVKVADVVEYRNRRTFRGQRPKFAVGEDLLAD